MNTSKRGRRPAGSDTRAVILEAARQQFGELGYRRTTLRGIATSAGVDPRLLLHYFGSKRRLFMESVELPVDPDALVEHLFEPGLDGIGGRVADALLGILDEPETRRAAIGLIRAAASEPEAAALIRELITERILTPVARKVGGTDPQFRASLMGMQLVGLAMARHVVGVDAIADASREKLVQVLTPVFDYYLTGSWTEELPPS